MNIRNIELVNNPAKFDDDYHFRIKFEAIAPLAEGEHRANTGRSGRPQRGVRGGEHCGGQVEIWRGKDGWSAASRGAELGEPSWGMRAGTLPCHAAPPMAAAGGQPPAQAAAFVFPDSS